MEIEPAHSCINSYLDLGTYTAVRRTTYPTAGGDNGTCCGTVTGGDESDDVLFDTGAADEGPGNPSVGDVDEGDPT